MDFVKYGIISSGSVWRFHRIGSKTNPKIKFRDGFRDILLLKIMVYELKKKRGSSNYESS
ncbi:MAG: hypothetical protein ACFFDX_10360 [Candidatus Odinarchaeota archaeon]